MCSFRAFTRTWLRCKLLSLPDTMNPHLLFNVVSALAPVLLIVTACLTIVYRLRMRLAVKVNCWFCNEDVRISRRNVDWWLCPWCEQYNGFSEAGDYSFNIPEQYTKEKKYARYCSSLRNSIRKNPSLCMDCNERESQKLTALSQFEPRRESSYDEELSVFKAKLEEKYPVCNKCRSIVSRVLNKQAQWLTRYKMLVFRHKPVKVIINNARKMEAVFRVISIIFISVIMYSDNPIWTWLLGGMFFHLCATWAGWRKKNNYNALLIVLWSCIILLTSIKNLIIPQIFCLAAEHVEQYSMIRLCASVMIIVSIKASSHKNTLTGSVAFKKLRHRQNDYENVSDEDDNVYTSNSTVTVSQMSKFPEGEPQLAMTKISDNVCSANSPQSSFCLDDSLSALSLHEDTRKYSNATLNATVFKKRIYNAASAENLFRKSNNASSKRNILAPPKLKSVTMTSWVAGGYWQESTTPLTLSRSSSQSSGFGSAGSSNLAFSREPSVHEFDRCSVISDTRSCNTPWPNATSLGTGRRGSPVSQYAQLRYGDATSINPPQSSLASSSLLHATTVRNVENRVQDSYVCRNADESRSVPMPVYPSHTTIIASPGWLSVMFCCSLILNMIVLCIILLHTLVSN